MWETKFFRLLASHPTFTASWGSDKSPRKIATCRDHFQTLEPGNNDKFTPTEDSQTKTDLLSASKDVNGVQGIDLWQPDPKQLGQSFVVQRHSFKVDAADFVWRGPPHKISGFQHVASNRLHFVPCLC